MYDNAPLAEVVLQGNVLEKAVDDGSGLEGGSRLLDDSDHFVLREDEDER